MLIKALCDYYDYKSEKKQSTIPDGYDVQPVSWQVHLTENGEISSINDYRNEVEIFQKTKNKDGTITEKPKKIKKVPREIILPKRTDKPAVCSNIIEHRPLYLFGLNYSNGKLTPDDKTEKAKKSHDDFVKKNLEFFQDLNSPICVAYKKFIENWVPAQQTENQYLLALGKEYANSYFCFVLDSDITKSPQEDAAFMEKYQKQLLENKKNSASEDVYTAICPILGEKLPVARTHDKIKFPGRSGCVLVSMDKTAYESYGKKHSYNSSISEIAMKKYTTAFNHLVKDLHHRAIINDMVFVFFALEHNDTKECDLFSQFFKEAPKSNYDRVLEEIIKKIKTGMSVDYSVLDIHDTVEFYVAGFTSNVSRICQKFMIKDSFGKIMENMAQHQIDMMTAGNEQGMIGFGKIAKELISPKSTKDSVSPSLMTGIIHAASNGDFYPQELLATVIQRVKTDHNEEKKHFIKMNFTRIGIIKAYINRKYRKIKNKEEIKMALNLEEKNIAYRCGRLFAVLEKIQQDSAQGKLNTTIVDGYFSSACSKPATVFPKLVELSNHHLKKLEEKSVESYKRLLEEIMSEMGTFFPIVLSLEDQGRFILGYYQQNQSLYTSNNNKINVDKENHYGKCN